MDKLHLGCGLKVPSDWLNLDGSWQVSLARFPYLRRWLGLLGIIPKTQTEIPWPSSVLHVNLRKRLPFPNDSFIAVYSSHLLEHLYRHECLALLKECWRVLRRGGVCRAVVPDLQHLVQGYLRSKEIQSHPLDDPARKFLQSLHLRDEAPPPGSFFYRFYQRLTDFHTHKWMYDKESLVSIFREAGFHQVEPKNFLDSHIKGIEQVEIKSRMENGAGVCVEGIKS